MFDTSSPSPQQLIQLLQTTLVGSTQQIREAEQKLRHLSNNALFLQNLMMIPKERTLPHNIHKAAIIYTSTYIKNLQHQNNYENLLAISKLIFDQFAESSLEIRLRRYLINTIAILIEYDKSTKMKCIFYQELIQNLEVFCREIINREILDENKTIYIGLSIQTILTISVHITKQLTEFIRETFINFIQICELLYKVGGENLQKEEKKSNVIEIFQIMKVYSYTFKLYMKKLAYCDLQTVRLLFHPQLANLLAKIWQFALKDNQINSSIIFFTHAPINPEMIQLYHSVKADYMQSLGLTLRIIFQFFKDPITLCSHPFTKNVQLTSILVSSIYHLLNYYPYYKIKSPALLKLLEQILNTLLIIVKSNYYYAILQKLKKQVIEGILFKILQFNEQNYEYMTDNPEELINQILQIVDMDNTEFMKHRKKQCEIVEEDQDIENYITLKTIAATLLTNYCKSIDGTLSQLLNYIQKYIYNQQNMLHSNQTPYSKSLLLLILGILRDLIHNRFIQNKSANNEWLYKIILFLTKQLQKIPIPEPISEVSNIKLQIKQDNLQYVMYLIILIKYVSKIGNNTYINNSNNNRCTIVDEVIPKIYQILLKIVMADQKNLEGIIRIISYDMITTIMQCTQISSSSSNISPSLSQTQVYSLSFIRIFLTQLQRQYNTNSTKILQILYNIYKYKSQEIYPHLEIVKQTLICLCEVISRQINKQLDAEGEVINKAWNIVTDVSMCEGFIANMGVVEIIQGVILQLCKYFSKYNKSNTIMNSNNTETYHWLQYDDHVIITMNSLLEINKRISPTMLQILNIVINTIFCGKNHCKKYEGLFETLCSILQYGHNNVEIMMATNAETNNNFINILINMILYVLNKYPIGFQNNSSNNNEESCKQIELVCIQSLLLLQDIIIIYGNYLPPEHYNNLTQQIIRKIDENTSRCNQVYNNDITIGNMVGVLALILMVGSRQINVDNGTTNENIESLYNIILSKIMENKAVLYFNNAYKIIIISLSELLGRYHEKWIYNRITAIMQCIMDIMIFHKLKYKSDNNNYEQEEKISELEKQYESNLVHVKNNITNINQLQFFKKKIQQLKKQNNGGFLQAIIKQLPEKKVNFLKETITTVNIGKESRLIFKIKR